ncbi:MAG: hypothetical protein HYW49_09525 [Deltaproteobacteria bacterium]|nr:hypothetical protein [Deltaproteobacteria bacterium]
MKSKKQIDAFRITLILLLLISGCGFKKNSGTSDGASAADSKSGVTAARPQAQARFSETEYAHSELIPSLHANYRTRNPLVIPADPLPAVLRISLAMDKLHGDRLTVRARGLAGTLYSIPVVTNVLERQSDGTGEIYNLEILNLYQCGLKNTWGESASLRITLNTEQEEKSVIVDLKTPPAPIKVSSAGGLDAKARTVAVDGSAVLFPAGRFRVEFAARDSSLKLARFVDGALLTQYAHSSFTSNFNGSGPGGFDWNDRPEMNCKILETKRNYVARAPMRFLIVPEGAADSEALRALGEPTDASLTLVPNAELKSGFTAYAMIEQSTAAFPKYGRCGAEAERPLVDACYRTVCQGTFTPRKCESGTWAVAESGRHLYRDFTDIGGYGFQMQNPVAEALNYYRSLPSEPGVLSGRVLLDGKLLFTVKGEVNAELPDAVPPESCRI